MNRLSIVRKIVVLILLLSVLVLQSSRANAQEASESFESFVYGLNVYSIADNQYQGKLLPSHVDTFYLLAGKTSIISPRMTMVYFWPITNQYQADWKSLNETVEGTLEVLQGNEIISSLEQTQYVIQYEEGVGASDPLLFTGEEASAQREAYLAARDAYRAALRTYHEAQKVYEGLSREEQERLPAPEEPDVFRFSSTDVNAGFALDLPPGKYRIRLRGVDGAIILESEKELVVFDARDKAAGYVVVPKERYISPERSVIPSDVIYARDGSVQYLQPYLVYEYNELAYTRYLNPQSIAGRDDRWSWVNIEPLETEELLLYKDGKVVEEVERNSYWVEQIPGPTLGYRVLDSRDLLTVASRTPTFEGFKIEVNSHLPEFSLRLASEDSDFWGVRHVQLVQTRYADLLYLIPGIPIVAWLLFQLVLRRRRKGFHLAGLG